MRADGRLVIAAAVASAMIVGSIDAAWAQPIQLAVTDCGANGGLATPTSDPNAFIATHFNFILDEARPAASTVAAMKQANPNLLVFGYFNTVTTNNTSLPAAAYLHDSDPGPLHDSYVGNGAPGALVPNPGSQDWINYSVGWIESTFFSHGYDGVMLDDVWSNPQLEVPLGQVDSSGNHFAAYATPPSWYNTTWWENSRSGYLGAVRSKLLADYPTKLVIFNGINEYPSYGGGQYVGIQSIGTPPTPTLLSDGFAMEGFATSNAFSPAPPADPWVAVDGTWVNMELALWNNSQNPKARIVATATYGAATQVYADFDALGLRLYALASYLLAYSGAAQPRSYFYYQPPIVCKQIYYFPEWKLDYGTPTKDPYYDTAKNVYRRKFTNGEVFVNPSSTASTGTITFQNTVYLVRPAGGNIPGIPNNLGGDGGHGDGTLTEPPITSLTLPPHSAAIVLNARQ